MQRFEIDEILFETMFKESSEDFLEGLIRYFVSKKINDFTIWNVTGNICEPSKYSPEKAGVTFDIFELGFSGEPVSAVNKPISYFEQSLFVSYTMFLGYKKRNIHAITFHEELPALMVAELKLYAPYLGKCAFDIMSIDKRMDLYVDYQKKVDFVKRAGRIFKALNVDDVISVSLNFFMEVFSADAVCAVCCSKFKGIGIEKEDMTGIFIGDISLEKYIAKNQKTEFIENIAISSKFNIKNVFFVYEETAKIQFVLFNILTDIIPDKEFSSLVSGIVSIAIENAQNHEKMIKFEAEEMEVTATVEILNKFVPREISLESSFDINAVTYPARNAGGDFIDLRLVEDKIVFCLADVCGKGYSAAVFTVVLSVFSQYLGKFNSLGETLMALNKFLLEKNFENRFITLFAGVIDTEARVIDYISCGHDPAVILYKEGVSILKSDYFPLGLMEENYVEKRMDIPKDALVFAYTDGLIEYTDFDSLVQLVKSVSDKTSKDITGFLYDRLVDDRSLQRDDFTCIVLKDKNK